MKFPHCVISTLTVPSSNCIPEKDFELHSPLPIFLYVTLLTIDDNGELIDVAYSFTDSTVNVAPLPVSIVGSPRRSSPLAKISKSIHTRTMLDPRLTDLGMGAPSVYWTCPATRAICPEFNPETHNSLSSRVRSSCHDLL